MTVFTLKWICKCRQTGQISFTPGEMESMKYPITEKTWTCDRCWKWLTLTSDMLSLLKLQYRNYEISAENRAA